MPDPTLTSELAAALDKTVSSALWIALHAIAFATGLALHLAGLYGLEYARQAHVSGNWRRAPTDEGSNLGVAISLPFVVLGLIIATAALPSAFERVPYWAGVLFGVLGTWIVIGSVVGVGVVVYLIVRAVVRALGQGQGGGEGRVGVKKE